MSNICDKRVRFELRLQAIQTVVSSPSAYEIPVAWSQMAINQNIFEVELLALYDAAIAGDEANLDPGEELDDCYGEWRDFQAQRVQDSVEFLAATGVGFGSSYIPTR